mmetsp:Transcript_23083/g.34202  ORF Transcript_23083/g.34202 Transcript_23083/m.34202 type:complete len:80 (-) Transcript_23083:2314-2553(-)
MYGLLMRGGAHSFSVWLATTKEKTVFLRSPGTRRGITSLSFASLISPPTQHEQQQSTCLPLGRGTVCLNLIATSPTLTS